MLNSLRTLVRRVDFYLRNEPYRPISASYRSYRTFEDLFEGPPDPLRTRVYWGVRRWAKRIWGAPSSAYYSLKYAYQRVTRGWDDRAVWSIDWWLDDKLPAMLRKLKQDKHGVPMDMFDGLPTNEHGYHDDDQFKIAEARWEVVIDQMIAAFEASRRIQNLAYDDELGEYPARCPKGMDKETWNKVKHDRYLASEVLRDRDKKIFEEGLALFVLHYWSLWD